MRTPSDWSSSSRWGQYSDQQWREIKPKYDHLHLWDGGVYDNLGVEALFKPGEGLKDGTDFLIVCDASRPLQHDSRQPKLRPSFLKASVRLVDVATDQVRSLRARMLIEYFKQNPGTGTYLRLGLKTGKMYSRVPGTGKPSLTESEVDFVSQLETTLRRLSHEEFSLLFRHGFEVADATLRNYGGDALCPVPGKRVLFNAA